MNKVGIWIDHKKAVIVSVSANGATIKTLESEVGPHARYSGRTGYPTPDGPQGGRGEKKYEERYGQQLDQYYDEVAMRAGKKMDFDHDYYNETSLSNDFYGERALDKFGWVPGPDLHANIYFVYGARGEEAPALEEIPAP